MTSVIFGVLLLVVGLVLSDIIIDNVNRQGGRISCFNPDDAPIKGARYDSSVGVSGGETKVPREAKHLKPSAEAVGDICGSNVATASVFTTTVTGSGTDAVTSTTETETIWSTKHGHQVGELRYDLEMYGADGLNQLFTLVYWIVLIGISLAAIGGGGYKLARANM